MMEAYSRWVDTARGRAMKRSRSRRLAAPAGRSPSERQKAQRLLWWWRMVAGRQRLASSRAYQWSHAAAVVSAATSTTPLTADGRYPFRRSSGADRYGTDELGMMVGLLRRGLGGQGGRRASSGNDLASSRRLPFRADPPSRAAQRTIRRRLGRANPNRPRDPHETSNRDGRDRSPVGIGACPGVPGRQRAGRCHPALLRRRRSARAGRGGKGRAGIVRGVDALARSRDRGAARIGGPRHRGPGLRPRRGGRTARAVATEHGEVEPAADAVEHRNALVVVWGPKGAPGRTTVAVNLAFEALPFTGETLLVDADTYGGSISQTLGFLDEHPGLAWAARLASRGELDAPKLWQATRRAGAAGPR